MAFRANGKGVSTSLKLKDASGILKNMEGNFEIMIPGKTITVSQTIVEAKPNQFTSTMTAQIGKAKNTIVTKWEKPSPESLTLSSSMNVAGMDQVHLSAEYTLSPSLYKIQAAFSLGKFNYSASTSAKFAESHITQVSADIVTPSRRIVSNVESKKEGERVSAQADFRWGTDRDDNKRVIISGNLLAPAMNNIDGAVSIQHPSLALGVNFKHSVGSKYSSKLEIQVDNSQFFLIDTSFGSYARPNGKEIAGIIDLKMPFKTLKTLKIDMNQAIYDAKYETNLDLKWNQNNVLSSKFTVKRPLSSRLVNVELIAKTPFKVIRSVHASLINKLNDGMFTIAKLNWNKQSVQVDVTLANRGNVQKTDLQCQINVKTSFRNIKECTMKIAHTGNKGQYKSEAKIMMNKKQYGFENEVNHEMNGWSVKNKGQLTAFTPYDKVSATWDHKNTYNDITMTSEMKWGKRIATVKYSALQDFKSQSGRLSSALEVQLPFNNLRDIVFQINHEHKPGHISSNMKLESERKPIAFVNAKYLRDKGEVQSTLKMSNPFYDGDLSMKLTSVYASYPMNGHLEFTLTPLSTITIDASLNNDLRGNTDFTFTVSSPAFDPLSVTVSRQDKSSGIESSVSVEYAPNKRIIMETVHKLGRDKMLKMKFISPFTEIYFTEMALSVSLNSFRSSGSIEAEPFIPKVSAEVSGNAIDGLHGNIMISTESSMSKASVSSEVINGERKSSATVEYQPGKIVKILAMYKLDRIDDLRMFVKLTTPFNTLPYSVVKFQHQGGLKEFKNDAEIEFSKGKKMSANTKFSTRNGYEGSIVLMSPNMETIKSAISHTGSRANFKTHLELIKGAKYTADLSHTGTMADFVSDLKLSNGQGDLKASAKFVYEPKLVSEILIESPFKSWDEVRLSYAFDGTLTKFVQEAEILIPVYGSFQSDSSVNLEDSLSFSLNLKTPIKDYKNIMVSLSHSGSFEKFESQANIRNGQMVLESIVKFNTNPAYNLELSLRTPLENYRQSRVSVSFEGEPRNFKSNFELQRNKETSEIDLSFNFKRKLDIDFTIRSPYMDLVKASIDHWGSRKKFNSKLRMRIGKDKVISDVRFQMTPSFSAFVSLKTPYRPFKNHQFSLKHAGNRNSFKCNMDYKCNTLNYNGDLTFQNLNALRGELNLKGSTFKPMKAVVTHDGPVHNFKSSGEISFGKKVANIGINLKAVDGLKSSIQIQTPLNGYESVKVSYAHSGSLNNFKCQGDASLNTKRSQFDLAVDTSRDISASFALLTPFVGIRDVSTSFTHKGSLANFHTAFAYDNSGRLIEGSVEFSDTDKITSLVTMRSNFQGLPNFEASLDHDGSFQKFKTLAAIRIADEKSEADISFDSTDGYNGKWIISMPSKSIAASFVHEKTGSEISSTAEFVVDGSTMYEIKSVIYVEPSLSASLTIKTPVNGYEMTEFTMNHDGNPKNFRSNVKLVLASEAYECDISFTTVRLVKGSIRLMPFFSFENFEASFEHDGALFNFINQLEVSFDSRKVATTEVVFNIDSTKKGSASFTFYDKSGRLSFDHEGTVAAFTNKVSLEYNSESMLESIVSYRNQPITLDFAIKVPMQGLESVTGQIKHTGDLLNFENHAELDISGKKTEADIVCNFATKIEARFSAESPYFPSTSAGFDISSNHDLKSSADFKFGDEKYAIDGLFKTKGSVNLDVTILTPIKGYTKITAQMTHNGDFPEMRSMFTLKTGRRTLMSTSMTLSKANGVTARMSAQSIFTALVQLTLQHKGDMKIFQSNAELRVNGQPFAANVSFKDALKTAGSISVTSPYTDDITGTLNMDLAVPSAEFMGSYGDKSVSGYATLMRERSGLEAKAGFKTPFSGFENINANFGYAKQFRSIQVKGEVEITPTDKYEFETTSKWNNGLIGSIAVKTPCSSLRHSSMNIKVDGDFPNIKSEINVLHSRKEFSVKSELQHDLSTFADVKIETPLTGYELMGLTFTNQGHFSDMATRVKFMLPFNEVIGASFKNVMTNNLLETKATLQSPFTEDLLLFDFELSGKPTNFRNLMEISIGKMNSVKSETTLKLDSLTVDFDTSLSSVIGGSSDEQKANFRYVIGENSEVSADVRIFGSVYNLDSTLQLTENVNGMLSLKTPLPPMQDFNIVFSHTGNQRRFTSKVTIQLEPGQVIDGTVEYVKYGWRRLQTSVEVQTPFVGLENTRLSYTHSASIDNFECDGALSVMDNDFNGNLKAARSPLSVAVQLTTPFDDFEQVGADMKIDFGSMYFNGDASVTYMKDKSISLISRMDFNSSPKVITARLSTPFSRFSSADINLSYSGDFNGFHSVASITAPYIQNVRAEIKGQIPSLDSLFGQITVSSQIPNFESLKLSVRNSENRGKYNTRMEASWSPSRSIIFEGSFKDMKSSMGADIFISTPFDSFRRYKLKTETTIQDEKYAHNFYSNLDGRTHADVDFGIEAGPLKSFSITMKAPVSFETAIQTEKKYNKYTGNAMLSYDRIAYKMDSTFDSDTNTLSAMYECPENNIQVESIFSETHPKADISINGNRYGYALLLGKNDIRVKAIVPSRTLQVSGSQNHRTIEGSFMWDADRDETKKVGFRSVLTSKKDSMKADVTLMMPTFGKVYYPFRYEFYILGRDSMCLIQRYVSRSAASS